MCTALLALLAPCIWIQETTLVFPWVSKNTQFESIVTINNFGVEAAEVEFQAFRATGSPLPHTSSKVVRQVPAFALFEEEAGEMFPDLGDGSGFCIVAKSLSSTLTGGWVTNNLEAASGRSPSQGTAIKLKPDDMTRNKRYSGRKLLFSYLPTTEGLTSAPVIVNIGNQAADILLRFYNHAGVEITSKTLTQTLPFRPFAAVANNLLENAENVMMTAESNEPLVGSAFVFNQQAEPAIGSAVGLDTHVPYKDLLMPWISNNAQFESILVVNNVSDSLLLVRMTAFRANGERAIVERSIPPFGFMEEFASTLFRTLGDGPGFSVLVEGNHRAMRGAWVTNNLDTESGRSPAQGSAIPMMADRTSTTDLGSTVLLRYLPTRNGLTSAPVIVNTSQHAVEVELFFYDATGSLLGTHTLESVSPMRPFAAVANTLIGDSANAYMIAQASAPLAGVAFVFNEGAEPAIGNGTTIDPIVPPGSMLETTQIIGPDGGTLSTSGFELTIPRNALSANQTMRVWRRVGPRKQNLTDTFTVEGFPLEYSKSLSIAIDGDAPSQQPIVFVQQPAFVASSGRVEPHLLPLNGVYGGGKVRTSIFASVSNGQGQTTPNINNIVVISGRDQSIHTTSAGHFRFLYPPGTVSEQALSNLEQSFEEAYDRFLDLGFTYAARSRYPIDVSLTLMDHERGGSFASSQFGYQYDCIEMNRTKLDDFIPAGNAAFHEYFHLVQSYYDYRISRVRGSQAPDHHWFNQATANWAEGLYSENPENHRSDALVLHAQAPNFGAETGSLGEGNAGPHGQGMASLFKYAMDHLFEDPNESLVTIYTDISLRRNHLDAFIDQVPDSEEEGDWWLDYALSNMRGDIYDLTARELLDSKETVAFHPEQLTEATELHHARILNEFLYPDLSINHHLIKFVGTEPLDSHVAILQLLNIEGDALMDLFEVNRNYVLSGEKLKYRVTTESFAMVSHIRRFQENDQLIVPSISNATYLNPYTNLRNVYIDVKFRPLILRFQNDTPEIIHILKPGEEFIDEVNQLEPGGCRCTYLNDTDLNGGFINDYRFNLRAGRDGQTINTTAVNILYTDSFVSISDPVVVTATWNGSTMEIMHSRLTPGFDPCRECSVEGNLFP